MSATAVGAITTEVRVAGLQRRDSRRAPACLSGAEGQSRQDRQQRRDRGDDDDQCPERRSVRMREC